MKFLWHSYIFKYFYQGINTAHKILFNLDEQHNAPRDELPTEMQINNFLQHWKKKAIGKATIDYGELEKWFIECSKVPDNDEESYIVDHLIHIDDNKPEKNYFRFTCSTKKLIAKAMSSNILAVDNTYKIVYQGFPLGVTGWLDKQRQFHPTFFSMCTTENEFDCAYWLKVFLLVDTFLLINFYIQCFFLLPNINLCIAYMTMITSLNFYWMMVRIRSIKVSNMHSNMYLNLLCAGRM